MKSPKPAYTRCGRSKRGMTMVASASISGKTTMLNTITVVCAVRQIEQGALESPWSECRCTISTAVAHNTSSTHNAAMQRVMRPNWGPESCNFVMLLSHR